MRKTFLPLSLFALSLILTFLSSPNFIFNNGISFFAWICYIPAVIALKKTSIKNVPLTGAVWGFLLFCFTCSWLYFYNFFAGLGVCFLMAVFYCLLFLIFKFIDIHFCKYSFLLNSIIFLLFEFIRTKGYLGFCYGQIVYSQWTVVPLVKTSRIYGVWGISFLIYMTNFTLAELIYTKKIQFSKIIFLICSFLIIILPGVFVSKKENKTSTLKVLMIQNNSDPWKNGIGQYTQEVEQLKELTLQGLSEYPDVQLVVWSESAVVVDVINHYKNKKNERRYTLAQSLFEFINQINVPVLSGNNYLDYNSAVLFLPKDVSGTDDFPVNYQVYNKNHLVPFSEDFPDLILLKPIKTKMEKSGNKFWKKGEDINLIELNSIKIGTPVCFEDTFSDITKKMAEKGADIFINVSNDYWSDSAACQYQHLSQAVFRSAETGLYTLRCTNSGQTCVIDGSGKVIQMMEPFKKGFLYCEVPVNSIK